MCTRILAMHVSRLTAHVAENVAGKCGRKIWLENLAAKTGQTQTRTLRRGFRPGFGHDLARTRPGPWPGPDPGHGPNPTLVSHRWPWSVNVAEPNPGRSSLAMVSHPWSVIAGHRPGQVRPRVWRGTNPIQPNCHQLGFNSSTSVPRSAAQGRARNGPS